MRPDGKTPAFLIFLAMTLVLAGCGGDAPKTPAPQEEGGERPHAEAQTVDDTSVDVVVTRDDGSLPNGCGPDQVAELISRFFGAFNAGDGVELRRTFAAEGIGPPLYGVGTGGDGRGAFGTDRREELLRYFASRHRHGERLQLLQVSVGIGGRRSTADLTYLVARGADDLETVLADARRVGSGALLYFGKGVVDCRAQKILAWNMDAEERPAQGNGSGAGPAKVTGPCPAPPGWKPGRPAVACSS